MPTTDLTLTNLRCEYQVNPLGLDEPRPRLGWELHSERRSQVQTAWQVVAASSPELLAQEQGDLWDSGVVTTDQSQQVVYAGLPLGSRRRVWWVARAWDADGEPSPWSVPAWFELGLLQPDDWQAQWITAPGTDKDAPTPAPLFRRDFTITGALRAARVYICGLGYHELSLNGQVVGDHRLDPAYTHYDRRALYVTHDVTGLLREGANALGVMLGNGLFNQAVPDSWNFEAAPWRATPRLLLQLWVEYADGRQERLVSDSRCKTTPGPLRFDGTRQGELYDARLEVPGWDAPGFDDAAWQPAEETTGPTTNLAAQSLPPIRVVASMPAARCTEVDPGVFVYDFGQNFTGWARLRVAGPAGARVRLVYGEKLDARGALDMSELNILVKGTGFQTDEYVLKGTGEEVYEPRFTYHGFRYVELTGFPGTAAPSSLEGRVVHTDFESAGSFACANDLLNRIQSATRWSYVSNFHGYPTDCPHREKNGWTGDALLASEAGLFNYRAETAYTKWLNDFVDAQRPDGAFPSIVPTPGWGYHFGNGPCWDSAYIMIPWYLYLYRGDRRILERHYPGMKRYVDYLTANTSEGFVINGLGDWVPPFGRMDDYTTPAALTLTAYYYADAVILAKMAALLGEPEDATRYAALSQTIKDTFNRRYYDRVTGLYASGTQSGQAVALFLGLVEPREERKVLRQLIAEIRQWKGRLNAGIHGAKAVFNVLSAAGRSDLAYQLATQRAYPSFGWMIDQGATTLWEWWDGAYSQMHVMYGDISAWYFKILAGIRPDPAGPGFQRFTVRPYLAPGLDWVRAEHATPYGLVRVAWQNPGGGGMAQVEVVVPPNTHASVILPCSQPELVTESGLPLPQAPGVLSAAIRTGDGIVVEVGSGSYQFSFCA